MPHSPSVESALATLASTGMSRSNYAPPLHRVLWRWGLNVPPPHFAGFWLNLLSFGAFFGVVWGTIMWFAQWASAGASIALAVGCSFLAGLFFGLCMALYYRHGGRRHKLQPWSSVNSAP